MKHKVVIIGASGHAKVIIDILNLSETYKVVGCTDEDARLKSIMGYPVLGNDSLLSEFFKSGIRHAFIAIGNNKIRHKIYQNVLELGFELINAISPHSFISPSVVLGKGIAVMPGAIINVDTIIGDNVIINTSTTVDHDCIIGNGSHLAPGCNLAGNVKVGEGTFLGVGCKVIDKIVIGKWSVLGAGSVAIRDIPDNSKFVGVPAKNINN